MAVRAAYAEGDVPQRYRVVIDRIARMPPALPSLGAAGYLFTDPSFGTRLVRVTDANTRPGFPGRSFTTPSAAHQLAWNATSDRFYVRSVDGTFIPYDFDPITMTASRIEPSGTSNGGLTIGSQVEPQFSFRSPDILFGSRQDAVHDWPVIRKFDFRTLEYTDLLNLGEVAAIQPGTYAGALSSSASSPERIAVLFGGVQDTHDKVAVFDTDPAGANQVVVDSVASTITRNGSTAPTAIELGFRLHHAWIDQSGRYLLLYPVGAIPAPYFVWDLDTDGIVPVSVNATGHDALGFGRQVNQACCTLWPWDAAQWQIRSLADTAAPADLINPVLTPQEIYLADHTSWNNARAGVLTPILSSTYRYLDGALNTAPWRAWDNEIVAIQTGAGSAGATVWRFAHHRTDVSADGGDAPTYFWYLPRAIVSPDGRWAIFTSNWEKSLGPSVGSDIEPGGAHRSDVFLLALSKGGGAATFTDDPLIPKASTVKAAHITELRARIDTLRAEVGLSGFAWTDPALGAGIWVKAAHVADMRLALEQAHAAAGLAAPAFTDVPTPPGSFIRVVHIQEVRDAVIRLESR